MKIIVATGNPHKFQEITAIIQAPHLRLVSLKDVPMAPVVEENGATFEANARKKAATLARFLGSWALADDSGLEVEALGGEPGVHSARYAGMPSCDAANNAKLLQAMEGVSNRKARFRCVIALADASGETRTVSGSCPGWLLSAPQGGCGFGYDPLFVPTGFKLSFAELDADTKNRVSHRAKALGAAMAAWEGVLAGAHDRWPGHDLP